MLGLKLKAVVYIIIKLLLKDKKIDSSWFIEHSRSPYMKNRELKQKLFSFLNDTRQAEVVFLHSLAVVLPKRFS